MTLPFDHLVLLVNDLDEATRDFTRLGFVVQERADTSHGATAFRFISFADGSYILLTAFTSDAGRQGHRLGPVMDAGEGWADYSFTVADATATAAALNKAGLVARGPVQVANVLAGGERWGLELLMCGRGANGDVALPFVLSDTEGRGHRIPAPRPHPNGATGINGLSVSTAGPDLVRRTLEQLGGSADGNRVWFGRGHVDILPLDAPGARPGGGMVSVILTGPEDQEFDTRLTHGAPLRMERA